MLHPVGRLPARVYWRRRLGVLTVVLALLAGGGWIALRLLDPPGVGSTAATATGRPLPTPALEQVLPSLAAVRTPRTDSRMPQSDVRRTPAPATTSAAPAPGGPCRDDMIELTMRASTTIRAGHAATVAIVVRNVSEVPCVRRLDAELQEVELFDADGSRVWGSNDCRPEHSDRTTTLVPREGVALEIDWSGLGSRPGCAGERIAPAAGVYVLRGRLDTATTPDRRVRLR
jgi:hypothetical protein